jgi:NAD(P)-dependent dehydrogenase (short-subunit alcohol dehydrogenase family)
MAGLTGRVVIVTGGGRGLGRAHCHELARQGATVVVNDLGVSLSGQAEEESRSAAEVVAAELKEMGATAVADTTSVTDWDGMEGLVARTVEQFGDLHAVVNNAGFIRDRALTAMSEEEFDAVIAVHLKGTFSLTRHACTYWRDRAKAGDPVSGRVVTTTSGAGLFGNFGQANYGSAKAGIVMLTRIAAIEMQRYGVTANSVSPIAATRMLATIGREAAAGVEWDPLEPANASPVVAWLCTEESGWLSGAVLRIDGNTVYRMNQYSVEPGGYRSSSGQALTFEELTVGVRRLFGTAPIGLGG